MVWRIGDKVFGRGGWEGRVKDVEQDSFGDYKYTVVLDEWGSTISNVGIKDLYPRATGFNCECGADKVKWFRDSDSHASWCPRYKKGM